MAAVRAGTGAPGGRAHPAQGPRRLQPHHLVLVAQGVDQGGHGAAPPPADADQRLRDLAAEVDVGRAKTVRQRGHGLAGRRADAPESLGALGGGRPVSDSARTSAGTAARGVGPDLAERLRGPPADDLLPVAQEGR